MKPFLMNANKIIDKLQEKFSKEIFFLILFILITVMLMSWVLIGHLGSDDSAYLAAARAWLSEPGYLPENHWAVRHTVTLPMALSISLTGDDEFASLLPSMFFALALVAVLYLSVSRYYGIRAAAVSCLIFTTTSLFLETSTIANADLTETFFIFVGFMIFINLIYNNTIYHYKYMILGIVFGLAFITRETTFFVLITFFISFLFFPYTFRRNYIFMGIGFVIPLIVESAYYVALGEDFFYRFSTVIASHGAPAMTVAGEVAAGTGNITDDRLLGPWAAMAVNQEFMLLFWAGFAGLVLALRRPTLISLKDNPLALLLFSAAVAIPFLFYGLGLRPLPRYFSFIALAVSFFLGPLLVAYARQTGRSLAVTIIVSMIVATNLIGVDLANKAPRMPNRLLVEVVAKTGEPVYVSSPEIISRSLNFARWAGLPEGLLRVGRPPPGALGFQLALSPLPKGAVEIAHWDGETTLTGRLLYAVGFAPLMENTPLERVLRYGQPAVVYRAPVDT